MHDDPNAQAKAGRVVRPPAVRRVAPWQAAAIARQVADALRPLEAQLADLRARVAARTAFKAKGVELEQIYWTMGTHDLVAIVSAADGHDVAAVLLQLGGAGNVHTTTLRAFDETEFATVLGKLD